MRYAATVAMMTTRRMAAMPIRYSAGMGAGVCKGVAIDVGDGDAVGVAAGVGETVGLIVGVGVGQA